MSFRKSNRHPHDRETLDQCEAIERSHAFLGRRLNRSTASLRVLPTNVPDGVAEQPWVEAREGDDARFLNVVRGVLERSLVLHRPAAVRVLRLDNWFGQRWLGFAGKVIGAFGVGKDRRVIPPFVPSRIVSEIPWRTNGSVWIREAKFEPLHKRMPSADNLERFFDLHCPETLAVWFSSRSAANGRGAVMVYSSAGDPRTASWYAELAGSVASDWSPKVVTGITSAEFASLAAPVAASGRSV
jgi:hypothetical protein